MSIAQYFGKKLFCQVELINMYVQENFQASLVEPFEKYSHVDIPSE